MDSAVSIGYAAYHTVIIWKLIMIIEHVLSSILIYFYFASISYYRFIVLLMLHYCFILPPVTAPASQPVSAPAPAPARGMSCYRGTCVASDYIRSNRPLGNG